MSTYDVEGLKFIVCVCVLKTLLCFIFSWGHECRSFFGGSCFCSTWCLVFLWRKMLYLFIISVLVCARTIACMQRSEGGRLCETLPVLHGFQDWTQVLGLNGKLLHLLSHLSILDAHLMSIWMGQSSLLGLCNRFGMKNYNIPSDCFSLPSHSGSSSSLDIPCQC